MTAATSITVRVPLTIRKRGGRKVVISPEGVVVPGAPQHTAATAEPALLKALARAFRWRRMLEDGRYASISDIARAEKLDRTYVGDIVRLTLLSPAVVQAIVRGRQPVGMTLPVLLKALPANWQWCCGGTDAEPEDAAGHSAPKVMRPGGEVSTGCPAAQRPAAL